MSKGKLLQSAHGLISLDFKQRPDGRWEGTIERMFRRGLALKGDQAGVTATTLEECVQRAIVSAATRTAEVPLEAMRNIDRPVKIEKSKVVPLPAGDPDASPPQNN